MLKLQNKKIQKKVIVTIYNEGSVDGGNVIILETYILTAINTTNFKIEKGTFKLLGKKKYVKKNSIYFIIRHCQNKID